MILKYQKQVILKPTHLSICISKSYELVKPKLIITRSFGIKWQKWMEHIFLWAVISETGQIQGEKERCL